MELLETEEGRVFQWRYESLLREGLDDDQATLVALSEFDLHQAIRMLSNGCSPEQLVDIAGS